MTGYFLSGYTDRDGDGVDLMCMSCPVPGTDLPGLVRRFTERDMNDNGHVPVEDILTEMRRHERTAGHA